MSETLLAVSEIFGPTIQGEGLSAGMPALFVRLAGCNLSCVWCDTPYTWDWTRFDPKVEIKSMNVRQVYLRIKDTADLIRGEFVLVITGGEPMLQQKALAQLFRMLQENEKLCARMRIEMETAGTIEPSFGMILGAVDVFNVSPKLAHSGNDMSKALRPRILHRFASLAVYKQATFKFVVQTRDDFADIDALVAQYNIPSERVLIMMEGKTEAEQQSRLDDLVTLCAVSGYRISPRLHVQIWGNRRGV